MATTAVAIVIPLAELLNNPEISRIPKTCMVQLRSAAGVARILARALVTGGMAFALQRPVTFDPVKFEFVNDEEANRFCSYAKRPHWWI